MPNNLPLAGKTMILTGTSKTQTIAPFIERNGGKALCCPLLEIKEVIEHDAEQLQRCNTYDWLIFTSQNAVAMFVKKCERAAMTAEQITCRIAAVGEKTAEALKRFGLPIDFMPTVYSADIFVQEFHAKGSKLFIRGSLAKPTITVALGADEWTVYETVPSKENIQKLELALHAEKEPIVVFASPSAVHMYAKEIVPVLDWRYVKFATIGHVTTEALATYGIKPIVQPKQYTMKAIIEQIILEAKL